MKYRQARTAATRKLAMTHVKRLVKKFGRPAIGYCLSQLRAVEREKKKFAALKQEIRRLSRGL